MKWYFDIFVVLFDIGLKFRRKDNLELDELVFGYVDSDYAGDLDNRQSTTGYVFTMAGIPIFWRSTL